MSPPVGSDPSNPRRESRSARLGKYVKRISSIFRKRKSNRDSLPSPSVPPLPQNRQPPQVGEEEEGGGGGGEEEEEEEIPKEDVARKEATAKEAVHDEAVVVESAEEQTTAEQITSTTPAITQTTRTLPTPPVHPLGRTVMQQERARALFERHGISLDPFPSEPTLLPVPAPDIQRVEKPIRMRVHRICHHCGTMYGYDKTCLNCSHVRCKKCPRHPPGTNKPTEDKGKQPQIPAFEKPHHQKLLITTRRSGKEAAYQPPTQRIRRTCHKCEALFIPPTSTTCTKCNHTRCTKCPREPAKLDKWPAGYPGDADPESDSEAEKQLQQFRREWKKPRMRVRWECQECHRLFERGEKQCAMCGHERCSSCFRSPPRKISPRKDNDNDTDTDNDTSDLDAVVAVEEKLRAIAAQGDSQASKQSVDVA